MNEKDFIYSKDIQLSGIVKWTAPSNIAIVKYWGKLDNQIPQNPSISLTLNKSITSTTLSLKPKTNKTSNLRFEFEGLENKSFENKTRMFLNKIENSYSDFNLLINNSSNHKFKKTLNKSIKPKFFNTDDFLKISSPVI